MNDICTLFLLFLTLPPPPLLSSSSLPLHPVSIVLTSQKRTTSSKICKQNEKNKRERRVPRRTVPLLPK